jgi:GTPase SAR1 family protein
MSVLISSKKIIRQVHLFLYDTAGQERFADMAASYYRVGEALVANVKMANSRITRVWSPEFTVI